MAIRQLTSISSIWAYHCGYLTSLFALKIPETNSLMFRWSGDICAKKECALHRCRDGRTDEAVKPVVIGLFWPGFPFVDRSASAFGSDVVFGGDLLSEHPVLIWSIAEDGQATSITHGNGEPGVGE